MKTSLKLAPVMSQKQYDTVRVRGLMQAKKRFQRCWAVTNWQGSPLGIVTAKHAYDAQRKVSMEFPGNGRLGTEINGF